MNTPHDIEPSPHPWLLPENWGQLLALDAGALLLSTLLAATWGSDTDGGYAILFLGASGLTLVYGVVTALVIEAYREELFPRHRHSIPPAIFVAVAFLPVAFLSLIITATAVIWCPPWPPLIWLASILSPVMSSPFSPLVFLIPPTLALVFYLRWLLPRASAKPE